MDNRAFSDDRPIDDLQLPELGEEVPLRPVSLREWFKTAGCATAQDIADLGCTGIYHLRCCANGEREAVVFAKMVRDIVAKAGICMTCYVPDSLYCLVHGCVGGLQHQQAQKFVEALPSITRELTPEETVGVRIVKHAISRRGGESDAHKLLEGSGDPDELLRAVGDPDNHAAASKEPSVFDLLSAAGDRLKPAPAAWECPDHREFTWACRYCLAADIVKRGSLVPLYYAYTLGTFRFGCSGTEIDHKLDEHVNLHTEELEIWARVGKLSLGFLRSE
jgi:hypothetical protein